MIIRRGAAVGSGLHPRALDILSLDHGPKLHHRELKQRPPLGMYNLSLSSVLDAYEAVLEELSRLAREMPLEAYREQAWDAVLLERQRRLLFALAEHLYDCQKVLRSFLGPGKKRHDETMEAYKKAVDGYRERVNKCVNKIKHEQGRLRSIAFISTKAAYLGYFVEGADERGSVGPDPDIHRDGSTAFSFSRDLRYNLWGVYMVSERLAQAIESVTNEEGSTAIATTFDAGRILRVAEPVSQLPMVFFPQEVVQPVPTVRLEGQDSGQITLVLAMPDPEASVGSVPFGSRISLTYRGDGATGQYRLLYPPSSPAGDRSPGLLIGSPSNSGLAHDCRCVAFTALSLVRRHHHIGAL